MPDIRPTQKDGCGLYTTHGNVVWGVFHKRDKALLGFFKTRSEARAMRALHTDFWTVKQVFIDIQPWG